MMRMISIVRVIPVLAVVALGGCATVTRGTTNQIQLISEPSGALAQTSLNQSCTTPCFISVSRKDEFSVTFKLPGYVEQSVFVKTQVAGAGAAGFAGNLLLLGPVGTVVGGTTDVVTGAALEHSPNPVTVTLERIGPAGPAPKGKKQPPKAAPQVAPVPEPTPES